MGVHGLVLCAGKGQRLAPLNQILPKPFLPIQGQAILQWNLSALSTMNLDKIGFVVNQSNKYIIQKFLMLKKEEIKLKTKIIFFTQKQQKGVVDAIKTAEEFRNNPLIVLAGDTVFTSDIINQVYAPIQNGIASISIGIVQRSIEQIQRRSHIRLDQNDSTRIKKVIEKPNISQIKENWSGVPIWCFTPKIWTLLDKTEISSRGEYDLATTITLAINNKLVVHGIKVPHILLDLTTPFDLLVNNFPYIDELLRK